MHDPSTNSVFPQLVFHSVRDVVRRLNECVWIDPEPVAVRISPVLAEPVNARDAKAMRLELEPLVPGDTLGDPNSFAQRWATIEGVPEQRDRLHLRWISQGESTLHVNGSPWAGFDIAHESCVLPESGELLMEVGIYQTGLVNPANPLEHIREPGLRFEGCSIAKRDDKAFEAAHRLAAWVDWYRTLLELDGVDGVVWGLHQPDHVDVDPLVRHLSRGLQAAVDRYRSEGAEGVLSELASLRERLPAEAFRPVAHLVGHAHIDLVWLWPEAVTYRKAAHTFSNVLRLMDIDQDFVFSHSSPQLFERLELDEPELHDQISDMVRERRWEQTGALFVESDTNLPCGEGLVRALQLGQAWFEQKHGKRSDLCWLPDVFGYSASLPQILAQGGVSRFYTSKLSWSAVNSFPYNTFVWAGHDGSELLAHVSACGYNNEANASELVKNARVERQSHIHGAMLMPTGFGDGGGGPTEAMCVRASELASMAGVPRAKWNTAGAFFENIEPFRDQLPSYRGELYLEYHRGTYTTRHEFKRVFRDCERAFQAGDAARALGAEGERQPDDWSRLVFAQFHDAIPGSSIARVYDELTPELESLSSEVRGDAVNAMGGPGGERWNPLPLPRTSVIQSDGSVELVRADAFGVATPVEAASDERVHLAREAGEVHVVSNGTVRMSVSHDGVRIDRDGQTIADSIELATTVDQPANFAAWDIDHDASRHQSRCAIESVSVEIETPEVVQLVVRYVLPHRGEASIRYRVLASTDRIEMDVLVENLAEERLLRLEALTPFDGASARFGAPFGSVLRPQCPSGPGQEAMWEVPASRWAAALDDAGRGTAIVSEASYGFSCREGTLGVSLVRTPNGPDGASTGQGSHEIKLAFAPYRAESDGDVLSTAALAEAVFGDWLRCSSPPTAPFALSDLGSACPAWVAPLQDGILLRVHETEGQAGVFQITGLAAGTVCEVVDLFGEKMDGVAQPERSGTDAFRVRYHGYQMLGVAIRPG